MTVVLACFSAQELEAMLRLAFEKAGHEVRVFPTARAAADALTHDVKADMAFVQEPFVRTFHDGALCFLQLFRSIPRELNIEARTQPGIKTIVVSGYVDESLDREAKNLGAHRVLQSLELLDYLKEIKIL